VCAGDSKKGGPVAVTADNTVKRHDVDQGERTGAVKIPGLKPDPRTVTQALGFRGGNSQVRVRCIDVRGVAETLVEQHMMDCSHAATHVHQRGVRG
jgi:hypothetical protein